MDNVLPYCGINIKSTDIASNSIILSIYAKDDKIFKRVKNELLIGEYAEDKTNNEMLLFNLACYYALKREKE